MYHKIQFGGGERVLLEASFRIRWRRVLAQLKKAVIANKFINLD